MSAYLCYGCGVEATDARRPHGWVSLVRLPEWTGTAWGWATLYVQAVEVGMAAGLYEGDVSCDYCAGCVAVLGTVLAADVRRGGVSMHIWLCCGRVVGQTELRCPICGPSLLPYAGEQGDVMQLDVEDPRRVEWRRAALVRVLGTGLAGDKP